MSADGSVRSEYPAAMSVLATLLRLFVMVAFVIGVGLPTGPADAEVPHVVAMASHESCCPGQTLPQDEQDELCRAHCLGLSTLPVAVAPAAPVARVVALPATRLVETAPSRSPLPEPHPPRL